MAQFYGAKTGVHLWATDHSDLEAYYCLPEFIQSFLGCSEMDATNYLNHVLSHNQLYFRFLFNNQRDTHNREVWRGSGQNPAHDDVWKPFQNRPLKGAKGKELRKRLWAHIAKTETGNGSHHDYSEKRLMAHMPTPKLATSLKEKLEILLES